MKHAAPAGPRGRLSCAGLDRRQFCRALPAGALVLLGLDGCTTAPATVPGVTPDLYLLSRDGDGRNADAPPPADSAPPSDLTAAPSDLSPPERDLQRAEPDLGPDDCSPRTFATGRPPDSFLVGTATAVPAASAFVCRDARGLYAVSSICTHQGFDLSVVGGGAGGFHCNWHGSHFALDGSVAAGPAFQPLEHYRLCVDGAGHIGVDAGRVVPAATRYLF